MDELVQEICKQWNLDFDLLEKTARTTASESLARISSGKTRELEGEVTEVDVSKPERAIAALALLAMTMSNVVGEMEKRMNLAAGVLRGVPLQGRLVFPSADEEADSDE